MTTLPNLGIVLPTRGAPGSGHWADTTDANYQLLDAHNHQSGKGLPINSAAISVDGDISFGSSWAITNMQRVSFASVTALSANNLSLFVSGNELRWRSSSGTNVQLTNGNSLNVSAFVGGIGGDYTSVAAAENYDDSAKRYTFKQGGGSLWAKLQSGGLRLVEFSTSETLFVEQLAPAALASSYGVTWPTALPGSTTLVQVDNTGQISFSNTLATDANLVLQGTGDVKHGNYTLTLAAVIGALSSGTFTIATDGSVTSTASGAWNIPVPLKQGDRVQSATIAGFGDGAVDVVVDVKYIGKTAGSSTKATTTITNATAGWTDYPATAGSPVALAAGEVCVITVTPNATGFAFNNIRVVYDRP